MEKMITYTGCCGSIEGAIEDINCIVETSYHETIISIEISRNNESSYDYKVYSKYDDEKD